jgi:ketosteroid isomerase-like protein
MKYRDTLGRLVALALLVAFFITGHVAPLRADPHADDAEARSQIEHRLREIFAAAKNKDFTRLESYHLYGPKFTRFSGSSPARLDADATRQLERVGLASLEGLQMRADALQIDVFGRVGIATFLLDYSFDVGGEAIRKKDRTTLVFVNENGDWKIVHEHLSEI